MKKLTEYILEYKSKRNIKIKKQKELCKKCDDYWGKNLCCKCKVKGFCFLSVAFVIIWIGIPLLIFTPFYLMEKYNPSEIRYISLGKVVSIDAQGGLVDDDFMATTDKGVVMEVDWQTRIGQELYQKQFYHPKEEEAAIARETAKIEARIQARKALERKNKE